MCFHYSKNDFYGWLEISKNHPFRVIYDQWYLKNPGNDKKRREYNFLKLTRYNRNKHHKQIFFGECTFAYIKFVLGVQTAIRKILNGKLPSIFDILLVWQYIFDIQTQNGRRNQATVFRVHESDLAKNASSPL